MKSRFSSWNLMRFFIFNFSLSSKIKNGYLNQEHIFLCFPAFLLFEKMASYLYFTISEQLKSKTSSKDLPFRILWSAVASYGCLYFILWPARRTMTACPFSLNARERARLPTKMPRWSVHADSHPYSLHGRPWF